MHGAVFSAWGLMLLAQVSLVAGGRRDLHKRLGMAGAALAMAMVVLGVTVAPVQARREVAADRGDEALGFLIIPLGGMVSFAGGLVVFAYELVRFLISKTAAWRAIAERIVGAS